jgi:hypothetical protein
LASRCSWLKWRHAKPIQHQKERKKTARTQYNYFIFPEYRSAFRLKQCCLVQEPNLSTAAINTTSVLPVCCVAWRCTAKTMTRELSFLTYFPTHFPYTYSLLSSIYFYSSFQLSIHPFIYTSVFLLPSFESENFEVYNVSGYSEYRLSRLRHYS